MTRMPSSAWLILSLPTARYRSGFGYPASQRKSRRHHSAPPEANRDLSATALMPHVFLTAIALILAVAAVGYLLARLRLVEDPRPLSRIATYALRQCSDSSAQFLMGDGRL